MNRYLLDTHVWLWMLADPGRLGSRALRIVDDTANDLLLSAASAWEIAIKYQLGKLPLPDEPATYVPDRMRRSGTFPLAVEPAHALRAGGLPDHHRDPFDRLLVAQAQILKLPLLTVDPQIAAYDVEALSADTDD